MQVKLVVKVDARPVARIKVPADAERDQVLAAVYGTEAVAACLGGREVTREVYVPGQIVNLVTRNAVQLR